MADNTKMPPNPDQRQRKPQGDPNKSQKPGGSTVGNPDRSRQGSNNPNKPGQEIDPNRKSPDRGKPMPGPDKDRVMDVDDTDLDEGATTQRTQRPDRIDRGDLP